MGGVNGYRGANQKAPLAHLWEGKPPTRYSAKLPPPLRGRAGVGGVNGYRGANQKAPLAHLWEGKPPTRYSAKLPPPLRGRAGVGGVNGYRGANQKAPLARLWERGWGRAIDANSAWILCRGAASVRDPRGLKAAPTATFPAPVTRLETRNTYGETV